MGDARGYWEALSASNNWGSQLRATCKKGYGILGVDEGDPIMNILRFRAQGLRDLGFRGLRV